MAGATRKLFVLSLAALVGACGDRGASGGQPAGDAAGARADAPAADAAPAGATADNSSSGAPEAPPTETAYTRGEVAFTFGAPAKWKLRRGKFVDYPSVEFGNVQSVFLFYSPDGKTTGDGLLEFNTGHPKGGPYSLSDMTINGRGSWRVGRQAKCSVTMSEAGPKGTRGTITCSGDPKGPVGPITFTALP
ncbi:MAG: hypothetical protein NVS4B3_16520 [Gemmatimonadaceae bacterium]